MCWSRFFSFLRMRKRRWRSASANWSWSRRGSHPRARGPVRFLYLDIVSSPNCFMLHVSNELSSTKTLNFESRRGQKDNPYDVIKHNRYVVRTITDTVSLRGTVQMLLQQADRNENILSSYADFSLRCWFFLNIFFFHKTTKDITLISKYWEEPLKPSLVPASPFIQNPFLFFLIFYYQQSLTINHQCAFARAVVMFSFTRVFSR